MSTSSNDQDQQPTDKQPKQQGKGKKRSSKNTRRHHGEGTVVQRNDGRFQAQISLGVDSTGKRIRLTRYGKTKQEAREKLYQALQEQRQGILITGPDQTMRQHMEYWLEVVHKPAIRIPSYIKYRGILDNHILPALGHVPLRKLTAEMVEMFFARLTEEQAPSTIKVIHGVLHKALNHAKRRKYVAQNVADDISLPHLVKYEIHPLTKEQARKLLEAVKDHPLEGLIVIGITTGLRRGELMGLRWQDINFDTKSLHVRRTVDRAGKEGFKESEPKTAGGKRKLSLPQIALDALIAQGSRLNEMRLQAGSTWKEQNLVFPNERGGYLEPTTLRRRFRSLLEKANLPPMRFHDLRHSAATLLLSMGVNAKVVQEILGHSQITMTLGIYSHVLPDMQQDATKKWDVLFGK